MSGGGYLKDGAEVGGGGGFANPMTTLGDMIRGGASGTPSRLAVGTEGQVQTVVGGVPAWANATGGVDTSLQPSPDTGWTATGTIASASGVVTATLTDAQTTAQLTRAPVTSGHAPLIEIVARVQVTETPVSGNYWFTVGIINSEAVTSESTVRGFVVQPSANGVVYGFANTGGSWAGVGNTAAPASITSGELWIRVVVTPYIVAYYAGSGATLPTTWTPIASFGVDIGLLASGAVARPLVALGREGGGSGDVTVTYEVFWRSLAGAPT